MEIRPIPEQYLTEAAHGGRLEELEIPGFSPAAVYLPCGYDESETRYSTFYLLHGGGGNPWSFFAEDGLFKNMLDHMIAEGDMDPLIVVTPTYYPPGCSGNGIAYAGEAVREFGPILLNRVVPLTDSRFRTAADRRNRGIGGFSMGAVATWYVFMAGLDCFRWFMPLSGDCWICGELGGGKHPGQTAALIGDTVHGRDFYLHALTGDRDIAFPNLDPQMQAMKALHYPFEFGKNTHYSILEGGVHDYPDIRRYIYNALPEFFRKGQQAKPPRSGAAAQKAED